MSFKTYEERVYQFGEILAKSRGKLDNIANTIGDLRGGLLREMKALPLANSLQHGENTPDKITARERHNDGSASVVNRKPILQIHPDTKQALIYLRYALEKIRKAEAANGKPVDDLPLKLTAALMSFGVNLPQITADEKTKQIDAYVAKFELTFRAQQQQKPATAQPASTMFKGATTSLYLDGRGNHAVMVITPPPGTNAKALMPFFRDNLPEGVVHSFHSINIPPKQNVIEIPLKRPTANSMAQVHRTLIDKGGFKLQQPHGMNMAESAAVLEQSIAAGRKR